MFRVIDEPMVGLKLLEPCIFEDTRGLFIKSYHSRLWSELGIKFSLEEEFYSISKKDVIRGMHFQLPPYAHDKVVYCISGEVLDVVLDMRKDSNTYGQSFALSLSAANRQILYIPRGFAHGFLSLSEASCMVYKTNTIYVPEFDAGICWDSFGFEWPVLNPIVSDRDAEFPRNTNFTSPF
jgi:dTDP-4-dehydrorhamnose 3,5-epimerase/CDP-3, 6-dideoxy-D-glycero-D-glycero-4-hexulose-5-epimerase